MSHHAFASLLLFTAAGCVPEDEASPTAPTGTSPIEQTECDDAPIATWDNFGAGFVVQHCQSCHATTTPDRQGAPEAVSFDTEEDAWTWADRILARAAHEDADMPPQGGVEADDRYLLEVWLSCGG